MCGRLDEFLLPADTLNLEISGQMLFFKLAFSENRIQMYIP
jgi:hypothetical protein